MSIRKKDLHELVDNLDEENKKSAYDFLKFLTSRSYKEHWNDIENMDPDDEPLGEEEREQLQGGRDYIPLEDLKNELGI